jgi:hypothetical protein
MYNNESRISETNLVATASAIFDLTWYQVFIMVLHKFDVVGKMPCSYC